MGRAGAEPGSKTGEAVGRAATLAYMLKNGYTPRSSYIHEESYLLPGILPIAINNGRYSRCSRSKKRSGSITILKTTTVTQSFTLTISIFRSTG